MNLSFVPCTKCGQVNWSSWLSASSNKVHRYCKTCRQERAKNYTKRKEQAQGTHTNKEWKFKLSQHDKCPNCKRLWVEISARPDRRYKYVWTKDHIVPLGKGGSDTIDNIQPLCFQCNFGKR